MRLQFWEPLPYNMFSLFSFQLALNHLVRLHARRYVRVIHISIRAIPSKYNQITVDSCGIRHLETAQLFGVNTACKKIRIMFIPNRSIKKKHVERKLPKYSLYHVSTYIYSLLIEKDICDCQNILINLPCVYVSLLSGYIYTYTYIYLYILYIKLFIECSKKERKKKKRKLLLKK